MSYNFTGIFNKAFNNIKVVIIVHNSTSQPKTALLNLSDNLSTIREKLERRNIIDDTFSFTNRFNDNEFSEVSFEDEENIYLGEIVREGKENRNDYILYLIEKINWKILNNSHKLDHGCTMTLDGIKRASERAFEMKNCELTEINVEGCKIGIV